MSIFSDETMALAKKAGELRTEATRALDSAAKRARDELHKALTAPDSDIEAVLKDFTLWGDYVFFDLGEFSVCLSKPRGGVSAISISDEPHDVPWSVGPYLRVEAAQISEYFAKREGA